MALLHLATLTASVPSHGSLVWPLPRGGVDRALPAAGSDVVRPAVRSAPAPGSDVNRVGCVQVTCRPSTSAAGRRGTTPAPAPTGPATATRRSPACGSIRGARSAAHAPGTAPHRGSPPTAPAPRRAWRRTTTRTRAASTAAPSPAPRRTCTATCRGVRPAPPSRPIRAASRVATSTASSRPRAASTTRRSTPSRETAAPTSSRTSRGQAGVSAAAPFASSFEASQKRLHRGRLHRRSVVVHPGESRRRVLLPALPGGRAADRGVLRAPPRPVGQLADQRAHEERPREHFQRHIRQHGEHDCLCASSLSLARRLTPMALRCRARSLRAPSGR